MKTRMLATLGAAVGMACWGAPTLGADRVGAPGTMPWSPAVTPGAAAHHPAPPYGGGWPPGRAFEGPGYAREPPVYSGTFPGPGDMNLALYCVSKYRWYMVDTGMYIGPDGLPHYCR